MTTQTTPIIPATSLERELLTNLIAQAIKERNAHSDTRIRYDLAEDDAQVDYDGMVAGLISRMPATFDFGGPLVESQVACRFSVVRGRLAGNDAFTADGFSVCWQAGDRANEISCGYV